MTKIKPKREYNSLIMKISPFLFVVITLLPGIGLVYGQEYLHSVDMRVPYAPEAVAISGKQTVYYELHLTNFATDSLALKSVEVFDASDSSVLVSFNKDDLIKRYAEIGLARSGKRRTLRAGASAAIYLEFSVHKTKLPNEIAHRVGFEVTRDGSIKTHSVQGAVVALTRKSALVLGPPLKSGPWAAIYDPLWERGHRRVLYTVNGKARIPGRFAIDFMKLDDQGRYADGDENVIKNWYGYADDVLAVADGVVVSTRNDFSESPTLDAHPRHTADKATGNYVSIDIGNNHFAFYEHLRPGSIKVKPGQKVKKGDVIASLGFTGQSTGPHLHFHVADANSPLGAEGIPFVFERFTMLGSYVDFENFGKKPWTPISNTEPKIKAERPGPNSVIRFE